MYEVRKVDVEVASLAIKIHSSIEYVGTKVSAVEDALEYILEAGKQIDALESTAVETEDISDIVEEE